tara:strand:- start:1493 stop:1669 length:177 start_codon:yes stop_codon:yes gene_type:complete
MANRRRRINGKLRRKKKDERTENQKAIDNAIYKGYVPKPNTKEKLKQYGEAYFEEKSV